MSGRVVTAAERLSVRDTMRHRLRGLLRRLLNRFPESPLDQWSYLLGDSLVVGEGTQLLSCAQLIARDPAGCSLAIGSNSKIEGILAFEKNAVSVSALDPGPI